jgi:hypothetical protein
MFETEDQARKAVQQFADKGYREDSLMVLTPATTAQTLDAAEQQGFLTGMATRAAEVLKRGHTLLVVKAELGYGEGAIETLNEAGAAAVIQEAPRIPDKWSELFYIPLLSGRRAKETLPRGTYSTSVLPGIIRGTLSGMLPLGTGPRTHPSGVLPLLTGPRTHITGLLPLIIRRAKSGWTGP